jgi:hypothetical protein
MDSELMVMNDTMNKLYQSVGEEMTETIHINKPEMRSIFASQHSFAEKNEICSVYSGELRHK